MTNEVKATLYNHGVANETVHEGSFAELVGFVTNQLGLVPLEGLTKAQENGKTNPYGVTPYEISADRREVWVQPSDFLSFGRDCVLHFYVVIEPVRQLSLVPTPSASELDAHFKL